jgi:tetratricopeptide (TPR) repeat protein
MPKSIASRKRLTAVPTPTLQPRVAAVRGSRHWVKRALAAGAALAAVGTGAIGWRWQRRGMLAPAPPAALALQPLEARLLAAAARDPAHPQPYLQLAEEYAASKRPASAFWAYSEAEARAPSDDAIRLKVAATLRQLGYPASAEAMLRAVAGHRGPATAQARLDLADLLLSTGRPAVALAELNPVGREADAVRGRAHEALGEVAAAEKFYRRVGAAGDPEGYERLVRLELAAGRLGPAREALRSLDGLRAGDPHELMLAAAVHAAAGTDQEVDAAIQALLRYVRLRPADAEVYYQAGILFLRKGDRKAARDQFERAVKLDSNHAEARQRLADLLQAIGQSARAHRERAAYYELMDQPDRSLAELRLAGAVGYRDDLERTLMAARTASELQQLPAAVKESEEGLKRHPGDPNLMTQLGLLYQLGDSRAALEQLCRSWTARDPSTGTPYWLLGRLAVAQSRMDEAIALLRKACALEPSRADFCTSLGSAYLAMSTPDSMRQARVWLEKAVALNPRLPAAHRHLGRVLEQAGDLGGACRQYLQSLDLQPDQPGVYNSLAQLSARLNRPELVRLFAELVRSEEERTRERKHLERSVRARPADGAVRIQLARLLIRNGQVAAARNQLERAAEGGADSSRARQFLAEVNRLLAVQAG